MVAPQAISAGIESPIGEPLAMLPTRVPELQTGGDAKRCATSASAGRCATIAGQALDSGTAAPMCRPPASAVMRCSSGTSPR